MSKEKPDLRSMAEQLARLIEVSVTLNSTLNQDELLQFIIRTATEILDCESVSILLYDEKKASLFFAAATGSDPKQLAEIPVPLENSLAGTIFRENKIICLSDVQDDTRHYLQVSKYVNVEVKNLLGVPMRIQDKPTGVLEAQTLAHQVDAHEGVKHLGLQAQPGGVDAQDQGRISPVHGVPGADETRPFFCLVLLSHWLILLHCLPRHFKVYFSQTFPRWQYREATCKIIGGCPEILSYR